jgi:hypothetical protein
MSRISGYDHSIIRTGQILPLAHIQSPMQKHWALIYSFRRSLILAIRSPYSNSENFSRYRRILVRCLNLQWDLSIDTLVS